MSSKKTQHGQRNALLMGASVLAAAAGMVGAPAYAQDAEEDEEEAIVVVGSRLVRQDFQAISPVTTIGAEQLEITATLTTDSLLNELPQIIPGNTRTSNNAGGEDFATVDLRGLGPNRTLVLINGERVPASSTTGVVDLNTIPASLISRIEVVTGGASAVYGSDALAGVVNFVLKDDYEGAEFTVTYGSEMETGNAQEFEINGLMGGNFANGKGNLTAYASYYDRNGVLQSEYDYSRVSGAVCYDLGRGAAHAYFVCDSAAEAAATINAGGGAFFPGGSGTPPWGWITNNGNRTAGLNTILGDGDDVITGNPFNSVAIRAAFPTRFNGLNHDCNDTSPTRVYGNQAGQFGTLNLSFNDSGQLTPRYTAGACGVPDRAAGSSRYNFAPDNFIILPSERVALTTTGHYDISDTLKLNILMNYTNSRTEIQLAPTPATGLTVTLTPAMLSLLSTAAPDLLFALNTRPNPSAPFTMDRRMTEVGTRNGFFENNAFYFLAGLEGSLGESWDWSLTASYGQNTFVTRGLNSVNAAALRQGLAGCQTAAGAPLGAAQLPGCVPLDIFGPGTLTPAMQSFIRVNTFTDVYIEENRVSGWIRGDLFELPAGPVAAVFGMEYRDSYAQQNNDDQQRTGNIFGFNAVQDTAGGVDVYELYTEVAVPFVKEVPGAHYLGIEVGYRASNYSSAGNVTAYKIGGEWAPVDWLRFRAVQNEATRAPSVIELFQAGDQGFPGYTDPCRDANNNGIADQNEDTNPNNNVNQAKCVTDFVVYPGFAANNSQVEAFAFGNPNLSPETAQTLTYGFVFQPDWFPLGDLSLSVDYYDIEITDVIAGFGAQFFLNDCYVGNVASSCARVVRDPVSGQVDFVNTTLANQGIFATKGTDIQFEWSLPLLGGELTVNELYSLLDSFSFNGGEFKGTTSAGIGGAFPEFKSVLSLSYNIGDWTLMGRWSYVPTVVSGNGFCADEDGPGPIPCSPNESPEASYVDVSARWNVSDSFTLTANVDNVMDEYPPQTADGAPFGQANTDAQVYRVLGRSLFISGRYRF
jgi:iron complex outermembrane recepter protein